MTLGFELKKPQENHYFITSLLVYLSEAASSPRNPKFRGVTQIEEKLQWIEIRLFFQDSLI